ncbi:unnamed protein product [Didymodactylos carnosus]|uniref:Uncharacterized protein n=1 Tax=Didymodactylos carnosus TaxID=1234261 RepID=A0A814SZ54_9BILA|nr:unnamed protein product [Didymodactylos carnosus]CAF3917938.1 unnamed protein product [Didymodactylos carnosus]
MAAAGFYRILPTAGKFRCWIRQDPDAGMDDLVLKRLHALIPNACDSVRPLVKPREIPTIAITNNAIQKALTHMTLLRPTVLLSAFQDYNNIYKIHRSEQRFHNTKQLSKT